MSTRPLPEGAPAAQGVDAQGVHRFLDALESAPDIEPHSMMIMRHGRLVASGWWAPYTADRPSLLYSLSKSFTSTAAGFAVAEGLLDLDASVVSYFPEFDAEVTDPGSRAMLVRHVASMASGHLADTWGRALETDRAEPVRGFLLLPPDRAPGTVFAYNQSATHSLAAIVQRVTGQTLTEYLQPRLFDPLGISAALWRQYPHGRDIGQTGLHAATDAVARFGQLYLQQGVWEGQRLLPASWVAEATRAQVSTADGTAEGAASDWQHGYGFQFWMSRHGYRGDGAYGQFCLVLPEHAAVIAITAATVQTQALLNAVWENLLPAFAPAPLDGRQDEDESLARRLARLALPPVAAEPAPPANPAAWPGTRFAPHGGKCTSQPSLTGLTVGMDGDGWSLSLDEGDDRLQLRLGGTGWTVDGGPEAAVPTAVTGGWPDPDTLTVDVVFLETPHRLSLTCSLAARTFTARWHTTPLDAKRLRHLRAPRPASV